jgi:hypothetical protein
VVISARSTVSLAALQQALARWETVDTAASVSITGIHLKCISSESADVTGHGYVPQQVAWRLGGCLAGNELSLAGNEDHVRIWNQPLTGRRPRARLAGQRADGHREARPERGGGRRPLRRHRVRSDRYGIACPGGKSLPARGPAAVRAGAGDDRRANW